MSTIVPDLPWKYIEINSCLDDWIMTLLIVQNYSGFMIFHYWKYIILGLKIFKIYFIQTKNTSKSQYQIGHKSPDFALTVMLFFTLHFIFTLPRHFTFREFYFIYRPTNILSDLKFSLIDHKASSNVTYNTAERYCPNVWLMRLSSLLSLIVLENHQIYWQND